MNRFGVLNLFIGIGLVASVTAIDCSNRPEKMNFKECCPYGDLISKDVDEQCKSFKNDDSDPPKDEPPKGGPGGSGGPGGPGGHHGHMPPCYGQCVVNQTGIVNLKTMAIDEKKLKPYLSSVLSAYPDFIQIAFDSFVKCADKIKERREMMEKDPPPSPPPGKCKPCASMLFGCVKREIMINCPSSAWKNDEACNNVREFMMNCKPPGPPKPQN